MQAIFDNSLATKIKHSKFSGSNMGKIKYSNEAVYKGEIYKSLPRGTGKLIFKENTIVEGEFGIRSFQEGKMIFCSGITLEGKFRQGRLSEGTICLNDGCYIEGSWGLKKNNWVIKKGFFYDHNKIIKNDFSEKMSFNFKNIEIRNSEKHGFEIFIKKNFKYENITFSLDGLYSHETHQNSRLEKLVRNYNGLSYAHYQIFKKEKLQSEEIIFDFGITLSHIRDFECALTFNKIKQYEARGIFELSENFFDFEGQLWDKYNNIKIESLSISKQQLKEISIEFENSSFKNISSLFSYIENNKSIMNETTDSEKEENEELCKNTLQLTFDFIESLKNSGEVSFEQIIIFDLIQ